ncbi:hypothetical protein V2J09_022721 [Rumex salicifolius]
MEHINHGLQSRAGFTLLCIAITALELFDITQFFSHMTSCSPMIHFSFSMNLRHHNINQPAALGDIRYPLHLRMQSFLHFADI